MTQTANPAVKTESGIIDGHTFTVIGAPGFYRARCEALRLYREHRTKTGAIDRLAMAIRARLTD